MLRFLAILLLVVLVFRLLMRFLLPILGKYAVKKATESMQEKTKQQTEGQKIYQHGDITIRKPTSSNNRNASNNEEDFVDYQEVE